MDVNISFLMFTTSFSINKRAKFICTWIYNYFKNISMMMMMNENLNN